MTTADVTLSLPADVYEQLQSLAEDEGTGPVEVIGRLVAQASRNRPTAPKEDPIFAIFGAYTDQNPLIDDIPVSEDPDLYLVAAKIGEHIGGRYAWEIAPARYKRGADGRAVRRQPDGKDE